MVLRQVLVRVAQETYSLKVHKVCNPIKRRFLKAAQGTYSQRGYLGARNITPHKGK
jgi:hypothetical protein